MIEKICKSGTLHLKRRDQSMEGVKSANRQRRTPNSWIALRILSSRPFWGFNDPKNVRLNGCYRLDSSRRRRAPKSGPKFIASRESAPK